MLPHSKTLAFILCAGQGSRLGGICKGRILVNGVSLIERQISVLQACGIKKIAVVVGHQADMIRALVKGHMGLNIQSDTAPKIDFIHTFTKKNDKSSNVGWNNTQTEDDGIQASVGAAIDHAQKVMTEDPNLSGMLIGLVDLPLLTEEEINGLFVKAQFSKVQAIIPISLDKKPGHPIWLCRELVMSVSPREPGFSLRSLLRQAQAKQPNLIMGMQTASLGYFTDLDTPECIAKIEQSHGLKIQVPSND